MHETKSSQEKRTKIVILRSRLCLEKLVLRRLINACYKGIY